MAKALSQSEKVRIIVYDLPAKDRVRELLKKAGANMGEVEFFVYPTDDVWMRDNGSIFVRDKTGKLVIEDWGFNGWGAKVRPKVLAQELPLVRAESECGAECAAGTAPQGKCPTCDTSSQDRYNSYDDAIPAKIAKDLGFKLVNLNKKMINEGGSVELDGAGTLMATRSSILNDNRNPDMTRAQAERIFSQYLGVSNFIWLDGVPGLEITDMHIDGFARFWGGEAIVGPNDDDMYEWYGDENESVAKSDIATLKSAKNAKGKTYEHIYVPLTAKNVVTT